MKTYETPPNSTRYKIVYVDYITTDYESVVSIVGNQAQVVFFDHVYDLLDWFAAGNTANLIIANTNRGGFTMLEEIQHNQLISFPRVILLTSDLTVEEQEKARLLKALDIFSLKTDSEKLRGRIEYLTQREAYAGNYPQRINTIARVDIPIWKRTLDVSVALVVLLLLLPVMLFAAVLIFIDHPGPVLYRSKRVGRDYRVFNMYKFRSMRPDAENSLSEMSAHNIYNSTPVEVDSGVSCEACRHAGLPCESPLFLNEKLICEKEHLKKKQGEAAFKKFRNDPRITRIGNLLRNSSIDELPQLFNILRGDMSLVGNRPLPTYEAERLTTTDAVQRFAAPAGLTGLWQVTKRGKSQVVVSDLERIQLDVKYANDFSFRTDLSIMLKTVTAVFQQENV